MKILLVSALKISDIGGVISHMKTLGKGFELLGHEVDFVTLSSIPRIVRVMGIYIPNILIGRFSLQMRDFWHFAFIKYILTIILLYKQLFRQYDLIITQDGYVCTSAGLVKRLFDIPVVLTVHSYVLDILSADHFKKGSIFEKWFISVDKASYNIADKIITVDTRIQNYISNTYKIPSDKIFVRINFVDIEEFKKFDKKSDFFKLFNIPIDKKIILCPRRLVMKNGIIYAAESIKYIKEKIGEDFIMIFTGNKGSLADIIKKIIERDETIKNALFLESIQHDQMKYLYNISDVVIIPSINYKGLEEATSISALEAMACCVPVIASKIGGLKEIIDDTKTGYLIQQKNSKKLAEKISEVLNEDQSELKYNARKYVENNCSHVQRAREYIKIINNMDI